MLYRIKEWDEHFESAKSKTYKHKRQCYMPNKHGLGYRTMVKRKNGAALFGAWCSLVQVLSRQVERQGYLTDTTLPDGIPLTVEQIALSTDMPEKIVGEMLEIASSQAVGWIETCDATDTAGIPQGYHEDTEGAPHSLYPYPSPLPSPLPNQNHQRNHNQAFDLFWSLYPIKREKKNAFDAWKKIPVTNGTTEVILDALKAQIAHKAECDEKDIFCPEFPYAVRWIKKRKWQDEITAPKTKQELADEAFQKRMSEKYDGRHE